MDTPIEIRGAHSTNRETTSAGSWSRTGAKVVKVEVDLNKKKFLYVNVCIDKSTFRALIDTGSMISIISKQVYDNLKKRDHHSTQCYRPNTGSLWYF